jgi:hypothetical protein
VDPVPDPLPLRKSGGTENRTRDPWLCIQELRPLDQIKSSLCLRNLAPDHEDVLGRGGTAPKLTSKPAVCVGHLLKARPIYVRERAPACTAYESGWDPEPAWTQSRRTETWPVAGCYAGSYARTLRSACCIILADSFHPDRGDTFLKFGANKSHMVSHLIRRRFS